jgi:diguanylate cyclase (GGDEF)-like protein
MQSAGGSVGSNVLCMIDLDRFKLVNDAFGHAAGDQVLQQIAGMLKRSLRPTDIVARMGGDEFALILLNCSVAEARAKVDELQVQVARLSFEKDDRQFAIGLSAGLVPFDMLPNGDWAGTLGRADAACYEAKANGRLYARSVARPQWRRHQSDQDWAGTIEHAMAEDRLTVDAQAVVDATTGEPRSLEIFVGMELQGRVEPAGKFMPSAQRAGLAEQIDDWVVARTFRHFAARPALLDAVERVCINISPDCLRDAAFYRQTVREARRNGISLTRICFEIAEGKPVADLALAVRIMNALRKRGVIFALDNFGYGTASYHLLRTLPLDIVKIDGRLVRDLLDDPVSAAMVASINEVAHLSGKRTVAQDVERLDIAMRLRDIGVDYLQGYLWGRPTPLADFDGFVSAAPQFTLTRNR